MKLARYVLLGLALSSIALADITSVPTYPGGASESVQVNKRGVFYGDSRFVYSTSTFRLSVPHVVVTTVTLRGTTYYFPTSDVGGAFLRSDGSGNLTWETPTSFTSSTATALAIADGAVVISSPTARINFDASQFIVSLIGLTTASISLDPSSVTVMGPLLASTPLTLTGSTFGIDTSTFAMLGSNNQFRTNGNSTAGNVFWSTATAGGGVASAVTIVSTTSVANIMPSGLTINTYGSTGVSGTGKGITANAVGATENTAGEFSASGGSTNYGINVTAGDIKQTLTNTVLAADANGVLISTTIVAGSGGGASGTITASPQFQIPFYSLSGTTTTIQGDSAITTNGSGFLTVDGGAKFSGNRTISAFNYATLISTITAVDTISNHRAGYFGCTSASGGAATCYGVNSSAVSSTVNQRATAMSGVASGVGTNRAAQLSASGGAANYALDVTAGDIKQTLTNTILAADSNGIIVSTTVVAGGALPLPGGATNYVQITNSLQSNSTFYVTSGTVAGPFITTGDTTIGNSGAVIKVPSLGNGLSGRFVTVSTVIAGNPLSAQNILASDIPVISSGIAFGSASNTVTQDTTTFRWTNSLQKLEIENTQATGVFVDPPSIQLYRTSGRNNLISFLDVGASFGGWQMGSNGSDFQIGKQNVTGGFASNPLKLSDNGAGSSTMTITGSAANSGIVILGMTVDRFVKTDANKKLVSYDLFGGSPTFTSSVTVNGASSFTGNINISSGVLLSGAAGTSGQVLTSGGAGTVPTWTTVSGSGSSDGGSYPSFVLVDTNTVTWSVTVNASGTLISTATTPPAGALKMNSVVIEDSSGGFWTVSIATSGALLTTSAGTFASSIRKIPLVDSSNITWILTANTSGNLITS